MRKSPFKGLIIFGAIALLSIYQNSLLAMEFVKDSADEVEGVPTASAVLSSSALFQRSEVPKSFHYMNIELEAVDFPTAQGHSPTPIAKIKSQPKRDDLKNKAGSDLHVWIGQRDQRWKEYKKDWKTWKKRKAVVERAATSLKKLKTDEVMKSSQSEDKVEQENLEALTRAAEVLERRRAEFTGSRGYYRSWGYEEFEELMFTPHVEKFNLDRPYNSLPRKKGSDKNLEDLVVGFILTPYELKIALSMLKRLTADLERELFALRKVHVFYESTFRELVGGWSREKIGNWWYLEDSIKKVQVEIDEAVRRQFDEDYMRRSLHLKRDLTTQRGRILAKHNRDELGQCFFIFFHKIKERASTDLSTVKKEWIEGGYARLPKYSEQEEKKDEKKEGEAEVEKKRTFQDFYNGLDETKERDFVVKVGRPGVCKMVARRVFPADMSPDFTKNIETFKVPSKAGTVKWENSNKLQMVDEFASFESMTFHRSFYHEVLQELHGVFGVYNLGKHAVKNGSKWKFVEPDPEPDYEKEVSTAKRKQLLDARKEIIRTSPYNFAAALKWQYDPEVLKEYDRSHRLLKKLLMEQRDRHQKLHIYPTFMWIKSYIPEPWRLFFHEPKLKTEDSPSTDKEIDLSNARIRDEDVQSLPSLDEGQLPVSPLSPFLGVNLSRNLGLTGTVDYGFNIRLTKLVISKCTISALNFIEGFQLLEFLDLSDNVLMLAERDTYILSSLRNLKHLNISNNQLKRVDPLISLVKLVELNVSGNQITSLHPLVANSRLKVLIARSNPLSGLWTQALPSQLDHLEHLDLSDYGSQFEQEFHSRDFKAKFPKLLKLNLGGDAPIAWLPEELELMEHSDSEGWDTQYSEEGDNIDKEKGAS